MNQTKVYHWINQGRWINKGFFQITETENKVKTINKSRSILSASLSDKSIIIKQPKEINVRSDSPGRLSMSKPGSSVITVLPDKQRIPRNIKIKKISETLIKEKESIQEPDKPSKNDKIGYYN